jgi:hypothetical protein
MNDPTPHNPSRTAEVRQYLHTIAQLLREVPHMAPETQQLLAELVDELSRALEAGDVPAAELSQLADHVTQLVRAAHAEEEQRGVLGRLNLRLEAAVTALEARAPLVAGLTRRLMETLANIGI